MARLSVFQTGGVGSIPTIRKEFTLKIKLFMKKKQGHY